MSFTEAQQAKANEIAAVIFARNHHTHTTESGNRSQRTSRIFDVNHSRDGKEEKTMKENYDNNDRLISEEFATKSQYIPEPLEYWTIDHFADIVPVELR